LFENLPRRPAPKIHVQISKILCVISHTPFLWRLPIIQRRISVIGEAALLDPAAFAHRRVLVRRIPNNDGDRLGAFDLVRFLLALRQRSINTGAALERLVWIAQGVRDVEVR
jgi:hypothetical protein